MDRRETIKSILLGSLAGGFTLSACDPGELAVQDTPKLPEAGSYGRTPSEAAIDAKLNSKTYFTESEVNTLATLCDLILPATETAGSASDAGVPEFLEFIVKDMPDHQLPLRGGLMWLDQRSNRQFGKIFTSVSDVEQRQLLDEIAYPDTAGPEVVQGVSFFSLLRNLVLTGYYTTRIGIDDLGYKGNSPNVWDGVPEDILQKHGLSYESEWLAKCIDQDERMNVVEWDSDGNRVTNSE